MGEILRLHVGCWCNKVGEMEGPRWVCVCELCTRFTELSWMLR